MLIFKTDSEVGFAATVCVVVSAITLLVWLKKSK
jgi:hypothetical protein